MVSLYTELHVGEPSSLTELPVQYADFAVWQRQHQEVAIHEQLDYWKTQLVDVSPLDLPTDHRRTSDAKRGGAYHLRIPAALSRDVLAISKHESLTPFMTLLAAYQFVLSRFSGQSDISVGTPVAGRDRVEVEGLIGFFVNTLVMRTQVDPSWTVRELLERVRETTLEAYMHRDVQFERLVEELQPERRLDRSPLFQVMLMVQPARTEVSWPGLEPRELTIDSGTAKFDLALAFAHDREQLSGTLRYNADLFDQQTIARIGQAFEMTLAALVADVEQPLRQVRVVSVEERRRVLTEWNDTVVDFGEARCVDELLERQVERTPDAVALVYEEQQLSFAELNRRVNQLAHHLRALGVGPEVTVALLVERSELSLIGIWGILKAGGGYVPLDVTMPAARVAAVLADARPAVLLTQSHLIADLSDVQASVVLFDRALEHGSDKAPQRTTTPENLAYVIYTSGSTGKPKGVAVQHRSLANLSAALRQGIYTNFSENSLRVGLNATLTFDASVKQWLQLVEGHTLEIIPDEVRWDAREFLRYASEHALEVVDCTPPQLKTLLAVDQETTLRAVLVGGDAIDEALWEQLAAHTGINFYNVYGPTECTVDTAAREISDMRPTIGRPLANVQTYFLDEYAEPVPFGVRGELCIGGAGVARGYLHQPELTAEKFIPDAFGAQAGARLYRSGDSGRYVASGELEFSGRVDDQVKIRGYRIEPGEIEAVLGQHAAVQQCKVLVIGTDDKRLVAYVVCDEPQASNQLRAYLKERLPEYMIPAAFVALPQMPLTPSGKIDRKALPKPEQTDDLREQPLVLPRTPTEQQLATMWSELLGLQQVSIHDNFFELGGHSLLLTQLASRMRHTMNVDVPLRNLFEAPTLLALAERIDHARHNNAALNQPPITRAAREASSPLSFAQERLWFIDQLEPDSAAYNIPRAVQLAGTLQIAALDQSLFELVRRHEVLRTRFTSQDGRPVQQVEPVRLELPFVDLSSLSVIEQQEQTARLVRDEARRPFDLRHAPLLRAQLLTLSDARHEFLFTMHHIISDGWSTSVLVQEIGALYQEYLAGAPSALPELPIQYADFAVWQRDHLQGDVLDAELRYWNRQLADAPKVLDLPTDRPRPRLESFRGGRQPLTLTESQLEGLRALSNHSNTTLFMTLLAVFQTLLYRYTGQTDILVGTPIANRTRLEIEPLIGFFVNTLVLRTKLTPEFSFSELLQHVRDVVLEAQAHQELPFERLVQELAPERSLSHAPLFQVMMVLDNTPVRRLELPQLELLAIGEDSATAKFDLTLMFNTKRESGELRGVIEYNTDLFDAGRIASLAEHFSILLSAVITDADRQLARLPLLSEAEQQRLLIEWNETDAAVRPESCVHELVAQQPPDAVALEFEDATLTYAELNQRANQLAHYLRRFGVGPDVLVGLCLERSLELVIGVLGILKAGGAYVPLDPEYPQERLSFMLADTQAPVIVTSESYADLTGEAEIVCLDRDWHSIAREPEDNFDSNVSPDNLAYVIYTSGSTGIPKGVSVNHRAVVRLVQEPNYVDLDSSHTLLQLAPISFDASTFEIWGSLINGARLAVMTASTPTLQELGTALRRHHVTTLWLTAGLFHLMVDQQLDDLKQVKQLLAGGDVLSVSHVKKFLQHACDSKLINGYGPTENTTFTCCHPLSEGVAIDGTAPIGRPITNTHVYVLDGELQPVPVGTIGQLYTSGDGLARGYSSRADLTAEKFIPSPFGTADRLYTTGDQVRHLPGGAIEFIGRADHQVKLRGFRIELGEIEAALSGHPGVRENVVVVRQDVPGEKRLVAYLVATEEQSPALAELRSFLREKLPEYMVPAAFVSMNALPLTANGKVDRQLLPEPAFNEREERDEEQPRTLVEEILAGVWAEVLGLDQAGLEENFFELGGHSLLAVQVASRVRTTMSFELPLRWVFEAPTVRTLAERIEAAQQGVVSLPPITRALREETSPLSFAQERLWFIDQLQPERVAYNIPGGVELSGWLQVAALEQSLREMVRRHEGLRTSFVEVAGQPVQQIAAELSLGLPLIDLQGLNAEQQEQQTERLRREQAGRPFDLRRAPLLRVGLLQLSARQHQFLFTMHHIISDGWSMSVTIRELVTLYDALQSGQPSPFGELAIQYADFAVWQRQHAEAAVVDQLDYWKRQLDGAPSLDLPADHRRSEKKRAAQYPITIPAELGSELMNLTRQEGLTPFMTLLAAYQFVLSRFSGQSDISVGTPVAGRDRVEVEGLIGFFVNTLVMRTQVDPSWTVRELLERVRETTLEAHMHRDVQFERLVEELQPERRLDRSPLFQVMLMVQPARTEVSWPGLEPRELTIDSGTAKFDLALAFAHDREQLSGMLRYNADLFDQQTIARIGQAFEMTLAALVADVEQPLRSVRVVSVEERRQMLTEWNDTVVDFGEARCVDELLELQVERTPDAVALVYEEQQLSFAELNRRVNGLAQHLRALGVGPETLVALLVERSELSLIGIWGILKAGGGYVPLDVTMPAARVAAVLDDARPAVLLTQSHLIADLSDVQASVVLLDRAIEYGSDEAPQRTTTPENLAYVIYTSGSTGKPKGVAVQHRSLANLSAALRQSIYTNFGVSLRVGLNATITFDASVKQWLQLVEGHTLEIIPDEVRWDAREFLRYASEHALEVVDCTPPQLKTLLAVDQETTLRAVLVGGDAIDEALWEQLATHTGINFFNVYGPTECTVDTAVREISDTRPTIGRPLANVQTYFLDEYAEPVPFGVRGELCIGGAGVARGYLHQPELTAEKFIPDAFGEQAGARLYRSGDSGRYVANGELEFSGRVDDQVKIRGYRIEPGEIEAVLGQHAAVRQCKVLVTGAEDKRLVAYVVCDEPQSSNQLRAYLKERLPEYMIPAAFVALPQMPLTASGKIDRKALPKPEQSDDLREQPLVLPRTPTEQQLADMWSELLGLQQVSIHDNFFELGGHSLLLTQLASRMRHTMNVDVPLRSLFESPTILEMGQLLSNWQVAQHDQMELDQLLSEIKNLSPQEIQAQLLELN
ncbi:MAG TPA: amino acid adenylation domain-containing protein [Pyrinomonadaceae bacterium]|nr:amino acid adenylation domain-containing protein [Pyrinomonadaceae bacterium]